MPTKTIKINRAPVLTLWATIVAERQGQSPATALTLGRAVAGLNAQSKARRLGLVEPKAPEEKTPARPRSVTVLGRAVPVTQTKDGLRALSKDKPIEPASVQRYLASKFGENLPEVRAALEKLADALPPEQLTAQAYALYEQFRPDVPAGERGWGAVGSLDLERIRQLAGRAKA